MNVNVLMINNYTEEIEDFFTDREIEIQEWCCGYNAEYRIDVGNLDKSTKEEIKTLLKDSYYEKFNEEFDYQYLIFYK